MFLTCMVVTNWKDIRKEISIVLEGNFALRKDGKGIFQPRTQGLLRDDAREKRRPW